MRSVALEDAVPSFADGIRTDFETTREYTSGSLNVFLNGILVRGQDADDGWVESGPTSFEFKLAPYEDARIRVYYEYEE